MPIGPKRSPSVDSMMQYTYLPRLVLEAASAPAVVRLPCRTFSAARRSGALRADGFAACTGPLAFGAGLAAGFLAALRAGTGARDRSAFRALLVGLGIPSAPAALCR